MANDANESLADRIAREGEEAVARLVQELSEQPLVRTLLERAFGARERAAQAQEVALAALNIPSASDIERLTRRIRSVSLRMEGLEDGIDRLDQRLAKIATDITALAAAAAPDGEPTPSRGGATTKPRGGASKAAAATPRSEPAKAARTSRGDAAQGAAKPRTRAPKAAGTPPAATPAVGARRQPPGRAARPR